MSWKIPGLLMLPDACATAIWSILFLPYPRQNASP